MSFLLPEISHPYNNNRFPLCGQSNYYSPFPFLDLTTYVPSLGPPKLQEQSVYQYATTYDDSDYYKFHNLIFCTQASCDLTENI